MQIFVNSMDSFFVWLGRASWQACLAIALVALTQAVLQKQLSARWRHALWLLVVIRLVLPWSIETRLSLFNWVRPNLPDLLTGQQGGAVIQALSPEDTASPGEPSAAGPKQPVWSRALRWGWVAGAALLAAQLLLTSWRLGRAMRRQRPVTDGALLDLLEDCKQEMRVSTPLTVVETPSVSSPSLLGFIRPRLLLPSGLTQSFSSSELRYVFLHELGHLKRLDIPLNWLMSVVLVLHWFNPLVWYALSRLRAERELACDALALSHAHEAERQPYGKTIIKLLEHFSRPAVAPGLLGILETQNQMKRRIVMIAKFRRSNDWPILAASVALTLALLTLTNARSGQAGPAGGGEAAPVDPGAPPRIIASVPRTGDTEVDPALKEITVTFDRDMEGGFSWTGGGPEFPGREDGQAKWKDKRTCVLPVSVQPAHFYRVGINAPSFRNFRSAAGVPAIPTAILFTTQGASDALKRRATKPTITALVPKNGARDVDARLTELRVSFNVPMEGGFSWTGSGPLYPTVPEGKKPYWTEDHKTCVLPVQLNPSSDYRLGLNSPSFRKFRSATGVPLDPVVYSFRTKD